MYSLYDMFYNLSKYYSEVVINLQLVFWKIYSLVWICTEELNGKCSWMLAKSKKVLKMNSLDSRLLSTIMVLGTLWEKLVYFIQICEPLKKIDEQKYSWNQKGCRPLI